MREATKERSEAYKYERMDTNNKDKAELKYERGDYNNKERSEFNHKDPCGKDMRKDKKKHSPLLNTSPTKTLTPSEMNGSQPETFEENERNMPSINMPPIKLNHVSYLFHRFLWHFAIKCHINFMDNFNFQRIILITRDV